MTVAESGSKLKELISQPMLDETLAPELECDGVKSTRRDMLFVTRDRPCWFDGEKGAHVKERMLDDRSRPYSAAHSP